MEEQGIILSVENRQANVQVDHAAQGCQHCPAACGQTGRIVLVADNPLNAHIGQRVRVETELADRIKVSFLFFALPTIALITGIGSGIYLCQQSGLFPQSGEMIGLIAGLLLAGLCYLSLYLLTKWFKPRTRLISRIIEIVD